jgi:Na+/H+-dicarboxylate symporter
MKVIKNIFKVLFQIFCVALITSFLAMLVVYTEYYSGENLETDWFAIIMLSGFLLSVFVVLFPVVKWLLKYKNDNH